MKNFLNSESKITRDYVTDISNMFYKVRYGLKKCSRELCSDLVEMRYELLQFQKPDFMDPNNISVDAGPDQTIQLPVYSGVLTGSHSESTNIISTLWEKVTGPSIIIENPADLVTNYTVSEAGDYVLKLSVTDNTGKVFFDTMSITALVELQKIYYGIKFTDEPLTEAEIIASSFITIVVGSDYTLPINSSSSVGYVWIAENSTQPIKVKWQDTVVTTNNGDIGSPEDLFEFYLEGDYRIYETPYATQFDYPVRFIK